jgi:hypothetical protein
MAMTFALAIAKKIIHWRAKKIKKKFLQSMADPAQAQARVLKEILALSKSDSLPAAPTVFSDYPSNCSWTNEPVLFYEATSGTSGIKKSIPYTKALKKSFENMFVLWLDNILTEHNDIFKTGKLFFSISPSLQSMGMQQDHEYLSLPLRVLLYPFLAVPPSSTADTNGQEFLKRVSIHLLKARDLEVISIWSPTYILSIFDWMQKNANSLVALGISQALIPSIRAGRWSEVWPNIRFISCWIDAGAQSYLPVMKTIFPDAIVQGKGLLATEGPLTIPWIHANGCIPLWNEVYLELLRSNHSIVPLYQMDKNEAGEILLSTKGGLLRYRLGDLVTCERMFDKSPIIRPLGRAGIVSDLVGEKLEEQLVRTVLMPFLSLAWCLLPQRNLQEKPGYILLAEQKIPAETIEIALQTIYHYKLARELQQIAAVTIIQVTNIGQKNIAYWSDRGFKIGEVKIRNLWHKLEDAQDFLKYLNLAK